MAARTRRAAPSALGRAPAGMPLAACVLLACAAAMASAAAAPAARPETPARLDRLDDAAYAALLDRARQAAWADRNAEAATLYLQALQSRPGDRAALRPRLAWQLLWSDRAAEAEPLFREWVEAAPTPAERAEALDGLAQSLQARNRQREALAAFGAALALAPDDLRLQRRRATSLLWNDRPEQAVAALEALARRTPEDRELQWMLANAYNFSGRHAQAIALFERWGPPRQGGERTDVARAWYWAGDAWTAATRLGEPSDAAGRALRDQAIARERATYGYASIDLAEDRDGLRTQSLLIGAGKPLDARHLVEVSTSTLSLREAGASRRLNSAEGVVRVRLGGAPQPTAWVTGLLASRRTAERSFTTGGLRARVLPADRWRLDAEHVRQLVETPRALDAGVTVDATSLSVQHRPVGAWLLEAGWAQLRFDDGTRRHRLTSQARWQIDGTWAVSAESLHLRRQSGPQPPADRGYWNPLGYDEARVAVHWQRRVEDQRFTARIGVGQARERIDGGGRSSSNPAQWELGWQRDVSPGLQLRAAAGASGQSFGLAGGGEAGYWRRYASVGLSAWWF